MKCHDCHKEAKPNSSRCEVCLLKLRVKSRARSSKRRNERKSKGLCSECGQTLSRKP